MHSVTDPVTGAVTWVDEAVATSTPSKGVNGVDYDTYDTPGERAEGMFVGKLIGKFTGETDGFCSTYREWHIMWRGIYDGFRAPTLGAVPKCPPLWEDEAQYYEPASMLANVIKCQWPAVATGIAAIAAGSYTGIIPAGTLSSIATSLMSMIPVL